MKLTIKCDCSAYVRETWEVEIPDDTPEDQIDELAHEKLFAGSCEFITQDVDGEHDRQITSVEVES